jgi:hypothetical protein
MQAAGPFLSQPPGSPLRHLSASARTSTSGHEGQRHRRLVTFVRASRSGEPPKAHLAHLPRGVLARIGDACGFANRSILPEDSVGPMNGPTRYEKLQRKIAATNLMAGIPVHVDNNAPSSKRVSAEPTPCDHFRSCRPAESRTGQITARAKLALVMASRVAVGVFSGGSSASSFRQFAACCRYSFADIALALATQAQPYSRSTSTAAAVTKDDRIAHGTDRFGIRATRKFEKGPARAGPKSNARSHSGRRQRNTNPME